MRVSSLYGFIIGFFICYSAYCQDFSDSIRYRIETFDGNEYVGFVQQQLSGSIQLKTESIGTITLQKIDIYRVFTFDGKMRDRTYWFDNFQATRYFWQPNGYGLKKGEAYYQNIWIFWNQVSLGLSDQFSMGIGVLPLFLLGGAPTPVWITPKVSIPVIQDQLNLGAGVLMGTVLGEEETGFGIAYGVTTLGSRDKNINVGLGYGYAGGDWAKNPTVTISGIIRTGEKGYILTENYFIGTGDESVLLLSVGGRRMVKRVGIDFALVSPMVKGGDLVAVPILGFSVPLGAGKETLVFRAQKRS